MDAGNSTISQTQDAHRRKIAAMYQRGDREKRPDELRRALFDYLTFLDFTVTGKNWSLCPCEEFSLGELEALTHYQETQLAIALARAESTPVRLTPIIAMPG